MRKLEKIFGVVALTKRHNLFAGVFFYVHQYCNGHVSRSQVKLFGQENLSAHFTLQ